ncbi:MAG: ABC transporter ATP-binding protein [Enhydrobacter sp.]|nr:ABC transporter ATP-binding protein [Enhydrobacter sp.]
MSAILEVRDLRTEFRSEAGTAQAVDGISLLVGRGETLALVGESGCGKSMTGLSLLRIVPKPYGHIVGGEIRLDGRDLLKLPEAAMRQVRGNEVAMIFQEPMTSLNPVFTIGNQIVEAIQTHRDVGKAEARRLTVELLDQVGIPDAGRRLDDYPHRLSGGMRQRAMIAMAISCKPKLLIADEPTTALDVTVQAQILALLRRLQDELEMGMILITHDLAVVAETASRVAVMYAGRIVENGTVREVLRHPRHPYTQGLLQATPHARKAGGTRRKLAEITGLVPSLYDMPPGCAFAPRCPKAQAVCRSTVPTLAVGGGNVACHFPG